MTHYACEASASSSRKVMLLNLDTIERLGIPSLNTMYVEPDINGFTTRQISGISHDGQLLHENNMRNYCNALMNEEDSYLQQTNSDFSQRSPAYEACNKGKAYFTGLFTKGDGGFLENRHHQLVGFAMPGVYDEDYEHRTCINHLSTNDDDNNNQCASFSCSAHAWAKPMVAALKEGEIVWGTFLSHSNSDYILDESGSHPLRAFCSQISAQDDDSVSGRINAVCDMLKRHDESVQALLKDIVVIIGGICATLATVTYSLRATQPVGNRADNNPVHSSFKGATREHPERRPFQCTRETNNYGSIDNHDYDYEYGYVKPLPYNPKADTCGDAVQFEDATQFKESW